VLKALDLDQASRAIRVFGDEARQPRRWGQLIQQSARQATVQSADDRLILVNRVPVGAVTEPKSHASFRRLAPGSEAQGGERPAYPLLS